MQHRARKPRRSGYESTSGSGIPTQPTGTSCGWKAKAGTCITKREKTKGRHSVRSAGPRSVVTHRNDPQARILLLARPLQQSTDKQAIDRAVRFESLIFRADARIRRAGAGEVAGGWAARPKKAPRTCGRRTGSTRTDLHRGPVYIRSGRSLGKRSVYIPRAGTGAERWGPGAGGPFLSGAFNGDKTTFGRL